MKAFLDGIEVLNPSDSLKEPRFTIRRKNEEGQFAISFTGDLVFYNDEYNYIKGKLVDDPGAINNFIELLFVDDCCNNKEYPFLIKPESLKWCDNDCSITANAVEFTPESKAYTCIENTIIWGDKPNTPDANKFRNKKFPKIKYCKEFRPSILQDAFLIIGFFTTLAGGSTMLLLLSTLLPLIGTINAIIAIVNGLGGNITPISIGGTSDPLQMLTYLKNLFTTTQGQLIAGCGYEHPSPLVRDYIKNVCDICGLSFQSSILNESNPTKQNYDYYRLAYFNAPIKSGRLNNPYFVKPIVPFIDDNAPIHNGKTFLDELEQPFNADWDVSNNTIRFERHDFFETQVPWLDTTTYDQFNISTCYEWSKQRRPSYADIGYQRDAVDWVGSEGTKRFGGNIIEWNSPPNPLQKGSFNKVFPYSAARFRKDGIERDVLTDYDWMPFGIGANISDGDNDMIMNSGTSFTPKLLIWDGVDIDDAHVNYNYLIGIGARAYNYPMWVDATRSGNLYDRFWAIENPRNDSFSGFDFTVTLTMTCDILNALNINGNILTTKGLSKVLNSIDLDFTTKTIIIKGTV